MQLSWGLLVAMVLLAAGIWVLRYVLRLRDLANAAALEACERLSLQFLDGTSAFGTWRWQREGNARRLRSVYVFDYTAQSIERRQGFVVLLGERVESVGFAQDHPTPAAARSVSAYAPVVNVTMTFGNPRPALPQIGVTPLDSIEGESIQNQQIAGDSKGNVRGNVQDLAEWRRTRRSDEPLH
jgi:hypothetical protein